MIMAFFVLVSLFIKSGLGCILFSRVSEVHYNTRNSTASNLQKSREINNYVLYQSTENNTDNGKARSFIHFNNKTGKLYTKTLYQTLIPGLVPPLKDLKIPKIPRLFEKASEESAEELPPRNYIQQQLFNPSDVITKKSQHSPSTYIHAYPTIHSIYDQIKPNKDVAHIKPKLKIKVERSTLKPVLSKPVENIDDIYFNLHTKTVSFKSVEKFDNQVVIQTDTATTIDPRPGTTEKIKEITSFTKSRPSSHCHNCASPPPSQLHRVIFPKKQDVPNSREMIDPIHVEGLDLDISLENIYDDDDKRERFINETLTANEVHPKNITKKKKPNYENMIENIKRLGTRLYYKDEVTLTNEPNSHSIEDETVEII